MVHFILFFLEIHLCIEYIYWSIYQLSGKVCVCVVLINNVSLDDSCCLFCLHSSHFTFMITPKQNKVLCKCVKGHFKGLKTTSHCLVKPHVTHVTGYQLG